MSPNAKDTNMLVFFALGDAKILSFALGDAKVPDARYFAFWWNIGFRKKCFPNRIDINIQLYVINDVSVQEIATKESEKAQICPL